MRYESFQIRRDTIHKNANLGTPIMLCHDSLKFQHDSILSYCNANAQLNTIRHGKKNIFWNCIITFSPSVCVQPMRLACDFDVVGQTWLILHTKKSAVTCARQPPPLASTDVLRASASVCSPCIRMLSLHGSPM